MIEAQITYVSWGDPSEDQYEEVEDRVLQTQLPTPYDGWETPIDENIYDDFVDRIEIGDAVIFPPYDPA